jgi:hypothetical protein
MSTAWHGASFEKAAQLGALLAKDYAPGVFELLVNYHDLSASETASRLDLHVRTAQDYLEALADLGVVTKKEVHEGKRPYFRYSLAVDEIRLTLELADVVQSRSKAGLDRRIRERADAGANFSTARDGKAITSVTLWTGQGRNRTQRRLSLTSPQGRFLFHLPFPDAEPLSIADIMREAGLEDSLAPEILDIVEVLIEHRVVAAVNGDG